MGNDMILWQSQIENKLPKTATVSQIMEYNRTLSKKDINQIGIAYSSESFEMATNYIWEKTMNYLRKIILTFGEEFALEMLGMQDRALLQKIPESYTINISYELGIISKEGKVKLTQSNELIAYYLSTDGQDTEMDQMTANLIIRSCVEHVLQQEIEFEQLEFCSFRDKLKKTSIVDGDDLIESIRTAPYFYKKTIIRALLNLVDCTGGAEQDNSFNNLAVIVPYLWPEISGDDRGLIGTAYTEAVNSNKTRKTAVLKNLLLKVRGFDYVPENLRSNTFIDAAKNIIAVHTALNNFYNEPSAVDYLYSLGTVIPSHAVGTCITALLCVRLGNDYGISFAAQDKAKELLRGMSADKKTFYLERVLPYDEFVLNKLTVQSCIDRWLTCVDFISPNEKIKTGNPTVNKLINATFEKNAAEIRRNALKLKMKLY